MSQQWLTRKVMDDSILSCTLLGTKTIKKKKVAKKKAGSERRGKEELLYAVTRKAKERRIINAAQCAAVILGQSRDIFFSNMIFFLTVFSPNKAQLIYLGRCVQYVRPVHFCLSRPKI